MNLGTAKAGLGGARQGDDIALRAAIGRGGLPRVIAPTGEGVVGRALFTGSGPQNRLQLVKDENRQNGENDG